MSEYVKICVLLCVPAVDDSWLNSSTVYAFQFEFRGQALTAQFRGAVDFQITKNACNLLTYCKIWVKEVVHIASIVHNLQRIEIDICTSNAQQILDSRDAQALLIDERVSCSFRIAHSSAARCSEQ